MDKLIETVSEQVPSLAVLVFIVWQFLRHLEKRDAFIQELHKEHLQARFEMQKCIENNTHIITRLKCPVQTP